MVAINDDYADGQDVSWLYDVSFESLRERGVALTTASAATTWPCGCRTTTFPSAGSSSTSSARSTGLLAEHPDEPRRIFCTYTAMMRLRRLLAARYGLADFGEEADRVSTPSSNEPSAADASGPAVGASKGLVNLVHLYPREMSIYGDLGNVRCLAGRIRRHGYDVPRVGPPPGSTLPDEPHLFMGGGGQDSGQGRVEGGSRRHRRPAARARHRRRADAHDLRDVQLFGNAFITVEGQELPG